MHKADGTEQFLWFLVVLCLVYFHRLAYVLAAGMYIPARGMHISARGMYISRREMKRK